MGERIAGWEIGGEHATKGDGFGNVAGASLEGDTLEAWAGDPQSLVVVPLPVLVALLRARGFGVVELGGERAERLAAAQRLAVESIQQAERVVAALNRARGEATLVDGGACPVWEVRRPKTGSDPAPAPSPAADLAARILGVLPKVQQAHQRASGDAKDAPALAVVNLRVGWSVLLGDLDEIALAEIRSAVEEAERLVGEG